jgi:L-threonylcarbamoyladenylate synthase
MMADAQPRTLSPDPDGVRAAAALLRGGRLVAFPTETVYGLGADARNGRAVAAIFETKGRPRFNPLIVHVADLSAAEARAEFSDQARALATAFWPGPLTLVLPLKPNSGISDLVTAGLSSVAIRVPAHPAAHALLTAFGGPVAAPSANPSGKLSPTTAAHVIEGLGGKVAAVLDAGSCAVGVESTILGWEDGAPVLLRPGGLAVEDLEGALGETIASGALDAAKPSAPGQLLSHYAPEAALRLDAERPAPGEAWLGFGPDPEGVTGPALNLSPGADLREAAANLFAYLRALDAKDCGRIAVAPIPREGLGLAIADRLARAAAPREGDKA